VNRRLGTAIAVLLLAVTALLLPAADRADAATTSHVLSLFRYGDLPNNRAAAAASPVETAPLDGHQEPQAGLDPNGADRAQLRPSDPRSATEAGAGLGDDALAYATRAEKLDHIFVPKHNLDPLVQQLGGREAVVEQMLSGVKGLTPASGTFEIPVTISGQTVVVRGAVVNGVVKLGTAFTP